jgi:hypothetical protein
MAALPSRGTNEFKLASPEFDGTSDIPPEDSSVGNHPREIVNVAAGVRKVHTEPL